MSQKNVADFREPDTKDAVRRRNTPPAVSIDSVEDVFLKPMSKPWTSPPAPPPPTSKGAAGSLSSLLPPPSQLISSTPHHFQSYGSSGLTLPTPSSSTTTTRQSLELFQRNVARYALEPPTSRPSLTTDFALSALKNSFSMSSLSQQCQPAESGQPPATQQQPAQYQTQTPDASARLKWERPFNSLTRLKERGAGRFQFRRSFGSSPLATKEDLANQSIGSESGLKGHPGEGADWPALQANYTYLMSCDLIESCRSLNGEMSWDTGDLGHLRQANQTVMTTTTTTANSPSVAVGCQTDAEIVTIPDLQRQLQVLREWLKRMESKVPKLILRPKWTRATLERRIVEYKVLQRDIESRSSELGAAIQRCSSVNPRLARCLENRYHRLLLRILEWTYHLEGLAKKPQEFWNGRRAAGSSPEQEEVGGLPRKVARLDRSTSKSPPSALTDRIPQASSREQREGGKKEMRQNGQQGGGLSPPLPAPAPGPPIGNNNNNIPRAVNMGVYEFKHPDSDTEKPPHGHHDSEEDEMRKPDENESSDNEGWIYSPNTTTTTTGKSVDKTADGSLLSVRKKLSFESGGEEEDYAEEGEEGDEYGKSWYQYSSSDSDWLQSGGLDGMMSDESARSEPPAAEEEEEDVPSSSPLVAGPAVPAECSSTVAADGPEGSSPHKEFWRVYDKEKVQRLVTEAEQMVSATGSGKRERRRRSYGGHRADHNSECDASSELTSDGETEEPDGPSKTASLNRTFSVPPGESSLLLGIPSASDLVSPVVMRTRQRIKAQRPWSLSGLSGGPLGIVRGAAARWTASETSLNHLHGSPTTLSPSSGTARPLMCHAATQKDSGEVGGMLGSSSLMGLSSSAARLRRRRPSARFRNVKSLNRRSGELPDAAASAQQLLSCSGESHNATLQALRLSASAGSAAASSYSSGECSSSAGTGSQRSRRVVKSSTLTRLSVESTPGGCGAPVAVVGPLLIAQSSPIKAATSSCAAAAAVASSVSNSSPRSAPSDGELGLAHMDETSNFSEQAWDNYLEPYASEAYSEDPPDPESARRLLEFGEDYRNDLDSLSDCPSSLSAADQRAHRPHHHQYYGHHHHHKRSPPKRAKGLLAADRSLLAEMRLLDSDSDVDDLVHVVETSSSQLAIALSTFHKVSNSLRPDASQYAELLATCRTNVACLQAILSQLKGSDESDLDDLVPTCNELKPVRDLIMKWEQLDSEVSPLLHDGIQQMQVQQKVQSLKSKLLDLEACVKDVGLDGDLQLNLNKIHHLRFQVESEKDSLLEVNLDVHSCVAQQPQGEHGSTNLKEDVAGLYQTWDLLLKRINEKQVVLEEAERAWKEIQRQLEELKTEIAADQHKIQSFIQQQSAPEAALDPSQSSKWMEDWSVQCDSGISSGSDGEFITLAEREKRLTTLRQLARKLDSALAPGNATLLRMNETLDQTQKELEQLQSHLAQLPPVKRSSPVPPLKEISVQTDPPSATKPQQSRPSPSTAASADGGKARPRTSSYFWRILRASLPFHLALLVLIIAACVMEPSCCNYLNNFGSSLIPKLSYLGGPPPT